MNASQDITRLLGNLDEGREGAMDELMDAVYDDLQNVAERHMRERFGRNLAGVTLEPAALVNESFMRLLKQRKKYENRGQFFAIATKVMLRALIDYQRQRMAARRGGDIKKISLSIEQEPGHVMDESDSSIDVEALVNALDELEGLDTRKADVVKLRVVWGLEMREIASSLDISLATVERDWSFAKAWLAREAQRSQDDSATIPV
ncbi:MAG: ECF-type sigma factor [Planctomycetota bacterium]|nr:ECF-type sigma factor [Planctomycetota bacterium]